MNYVPPSAPQPIGGVIDDAIRLFRASWSRCWYFAAIPSLAGMVFTLALPLPILANPRSSAANILQFYQSLISPRVIGFYFLILIVSVIFQGAVLAREA